MNVPAVCTDCRATPLEAAAEARAHPKSATAAALSKSERAAADPLKLSDTAQAAKALAVSAPVDTVKVDALRSAIAHGRYPLDPAAVAAKMIVLDLP